MTEAIACPPSLLRGTEVLTGEELAAAVRGMTRAPSKVEEHVSADGSQRYIEVSWRDGACLLAVVAALSHEHPESTWGGGSSIDLVLQAGPVSVSVELTRFISPWLVAAAAAGSDEPCTASGWSTAWTTTTGRCDADTVDPAQAAIWSHVFEVAAADRPGIGHPNRVYALNRQRVLALAAAAST